MLERVNSPGKTQSPHAEWEELKLIFRSIVPKSVLGTILNVAILTFVLSPVFPFLTLAIWASANAVVAMVGLGLRWYFLKKVAEQKMRLWKRIQKIRLTISGIVFGGLVYLWPPAIDPIYFMFYYFALGGMVAAALATYSISPRLFFFYAVPAIFPATVAIAWTMGHLATTMLVMATLFCAVLFSIEPSISRVISDSIGYYLRNQSLAEKLAQEKAVVEQLNGQLKELSVRDPLTQLRNRRFIDEYLGNELEALRKRWSFLIKSKDKATAAEMIPYGVLLLDIDHFKNVNDEHGHEVGDEMLKLVSRTISSVVRLDDSVVRWGGEEFLIVLKSCPFERQNDVAEKIRRAIGEASLKLEDGSTLKAACSLGVASFPTHVFDTVHLSFDQTVAMADCALYQAKKAGRNRSFRAQFKHHRVSLWLVEHLQSADVSIHHLLEDGYIEVNAVTSEGPEKTSH